MKRNFSFFPNKTLHVSALTLTKVIGERKYTTLELNCEIVALRYFELLIWFLINNSFEDRTVEHLNN